MNKSSEKKKIMEDYKNHNGSQYDKFCYFLIIFISCQNEKIIELSPFGFLYWY